MEKDNILKDDTFNTLCFSVKRHSAEQSSEPHGNQFPNVSGSPQGYVPALLSLIVLTAGSSYFETISLLTAYLLKHTLL